MQATDKNFILVSQITNLLVENNCTVKDATELLNYVSREIIANSKVQEVELKIK